MNKSKIIIIILYIKIQKIKIRLKKILNNDYLKLAVNGREFN